MKKPVMFVESWHVYPFDILFAFGATDEQVYKELKRLGTELDDKDKEEVRIQTQSGAARTVMLSGGQTIVRLKHNTKTPKNIGYLSHEIFHAVTFLFSRIGITLSDTSDEAFAYAIGYMTEKAVARLGRK